MNTDPNLTEHDDKSRTTTADEPRSAPLLQVRVIAATGYAQAVIADVANRIRPLLGDNIRYTTTTRPARRAGHVRAYLTVTRKEATADDHHHDTG